MHDDHDDHPDPHDEAGEHPPEHSADEHDEHAEAEETVEAVQEGVEAGGELIETIEKAAEGDAAGALAGGIGTAGGIVGTIAGLVDDEDAKRALEGVETVLEVAGAVTEVGEKLAGLGGHGGGHGASGQGASGHGASGHGASGHGAAARHGRTDDLVSAETVFGAGTSRNVHYELSVEGSDVEFAVQSVYLSETLSALPSCSVTATCAASALEGEGDLFDKEITLTIERGDDQRHFRGLVRRAHVRDGADEQRVELDVVVGLWLLSQNQDSRVFQDITVPDLVKLLVQESLGARHRTVRRTELTATYEPHEYLVQYRESTYELIHRLCDEEGIWFYFDHAEDGREVLVLCDSNENRPRITGGDGGRVEHSEQGNAHELAEVAYGFERSRWIGPTDAVHSGYDWTHPPLEVRHGDTGHGETTGSALEVHEHQGAVRHHGYDGTQYGQHTAQRRARAHRERLALGRQQWSCSTSVVGVEPGHVIELTSAGEHDGRYLIVAVGITGQRGEAAGGYHAALELVPIEVPYRPAPPSRPRAFGPETATVVGPSGEEIHCDNHGRVRVQFHWDRRGQRDERSSVWIRVAQFWAGQGWGAMFIPRIGTEVVVSFLGGDPDRPLITGRLYNGDHPVPYLLPEHKTRSTIMTNSSPGKNGFNELRFEDKAGSEEVYIHAEKDFNEEVKNCHSTHVGRDQSNTVDRDQTELVKRDQTLTVKRDRNKLVERHEKQQVQGNRTVRVGPDGGDDELWVEKNRTERVDGSRDALTVTSGDKFTDVVQGEWDITTKGQFKVLQNSENELTIHNNAYLDTAGRVQLKAGHGQVHYDATAAGKLKIKTTGPAWIQSDLDQKYEASGDSMIHAHNKLVLRGDAEITIVCGSSTIKLSSTGIEIVGPTVKINSTAGDTEIDASAQVKIKC